MTVRQPYSAALFPVACRRATGTNSRMMPCSSVLATTISTLSTKTCHSKYTSVRWPRKRRSNTHTLFCDHFFVCILLTLFFVRLQDIITEISETERNFKILVYANGFKKIRITEKIIKELGIDTFAYERTNVGRRRRAMKEKVYYSKLMMMFMMKIRKFIVYI